MILALHIASSTSHLILLDSLSHKFIETEDWESGRNLSTELLTRIRDLLAANHDAFTDLTAIVIFSGPGSFTSLRIGHTTANALADSLGIPIVGELGDDWLTHGLTVVARAQAGAFALPFYGAEANITKPKS